MLDSDRLTLHKSRKYSPLQAAFDGFMLSKEAQRCTPRTLDHYVYTVGSFVAYLKAQNVTALEQITPRHVRLYLVSLQERNLKDTTQHAHARGIKTWLFWLVTEGDLDESPMRVVAMPRLDKRVPPPFSPEDIKALLAGCDRKTPRGTRDYAIVIGLLDTGLRLAEFASLKTDSVNMRTGLTMVMGKGRKQRQVRFGAKARQALARWLGVRMNMETTSDSLWLLKPQGIAIMLRRLGRRVGADPCGPHRFRRTFALWCMRDGMDLHSLRMLMGHSSLAVLQRYLALAGQDIERAHKAHSPADNLL